MHGTAAPKPPWLHGVLIWKNTDYGLLYRFSDASSVMGIGFAI